MSTLRLSNSEMTAFRKCKRKWYLSHHRRLRSRVEPGYGSALSVGTLVHDALAAYYDPELRADPVQYAWKLVESELETNPGYDIEISKEWDLVKAMLEGYTEWLEETGVDSDLVFEGSERMVEIPMTDDVTLISKLDAPVSQISDGAKLLLEHKTVGSMEPNTVLKLDTQLLTEHLVRFLDAQRKGASTDEAYEQCHGVMYNMLRKVKRTSRATPPFYARTVVYHNVHELRNHWFHVLAVAREIQDAHRRLDAGESHHSVTPPSPSADCKWSCPFFKVCVMHDDGSQVEAAIEAMYEECDPLERYQGAEVL